jgi:hypothetical protein
MAGFHSPAKVEKYSRKTKERREKERRKSGVSRLDLRVERRKSGVRAA